MSSRDELIKQLQERRRFGKRPQREDNAAAQAMAEAKLQASASSAWLLPRSRASRNKARRPLYCTAKAPLAPLPSLSSVLTLVVDSGLLMTAPAYNQALFEMASQSLAELAPAEQKAGKRTLAQESHFSAPGWLTPSRRNASRLVMEDLKDWVQLGRTLGPAPILKGLLGGS